jgi:AmiR/NasT family two-component response regulator
MNLQEERPTKVRIAAKAKSRSNQEQAERNELLLRAKTMLMAKHGWDEPQAHRFLQKKSMNCRKNIHQIAEALLLSNELLIPQ